MDFASERCTFPHSIREDNKIYMGRNSLGDDGKITAISEIYKAFVSV
jgi:hypothetical protein